VSTPVSVALGSGVVEIGLRGPADTRSPSGDGAARDEPVSESARNLVASIVMCDRLPTALHDEHSSDW